MYLSMTSMCLHPCHHDWHRCHTCLCSAWTSCTSWTAWTAWTSRATKRTMHGLHGLHGLPPRAKLLATFLFSLVSPDEVQPGCAARLATSPCPCIHMHCLWCVLRFVYVVVHRTHATCLHVDHCSTQVQLPIESGEIHACSTLCICVVQLHPFSVIARLARPSPPLTAAPRRPCSPCSLCKEAHACFTCSVLARSPCASRLERS